MKRESPYSLGLVNFPVQLTDSICHLQVKFLGEMLSRNSNYRLKYCTTWIFQRLVRMIFGRVHHRVFPKGKACKLFFFWPCSLVLETISVVCSQSEVTCEPLKFTCHSSHWLWHFFLQFRPLLAQDCTGQMLACSLFVPSWLIRYTWHIWCVCCIICKRAL